MITVPDALFVQRDTQAEDGVLTAKDVQSDAGFPSRWVVDAQPGEGDCDGEDGEENGDVRAAIQSRNEFIL